MLVDHDAGRDLQPCLRRQFDIGQDADADHDQVGLDMPPVAEADAGDLAAVALDAGDLHAEMNADTGRGVPRLKVFRDFRGHRARHHPRRELDDVDFEALGPRGRGKFEADESGADHDDALARRDVVCRRDWLSSSVRK